MADTNTKTALDLITSGLRKIGIYQPGETLSAQDANDGLDVLNGYLDILSTQHGGNYNNIETVVTLTSGKQVYSVGIGGDINIERPLRISQAYSRLTTTGSPVDFSCAIWPIEKYTTIGMKFQPGPWPKVMYYNTDYPFSKIILWPIPTQAVELHFWSDQVLSNLSLNSLLNLPRGYYLFLQYKLAVLFSSEYGIQVPSDVRQMAIEMERNIKALNMTPQSESPIDATIVSSGGSNAGFFLTGGF